MPRRGTASITDRSLQVPNDRLQFDRGYEIGQSVGHQRHATVFDCSDSAAIDRLPCPIGAGQRDCGRRFAVDRVDK